MSGVLITMGGMALKGVWCTADEILLNGWEDL